MGCLEIEPDHVHQRDMCANSGEEMRQELLSSALRPIITEFLETLDYKPPPKADNEALRAGMLKYAIASGIPYGARGEKNEKHAKQCFLTGLSVAADMYPSHPLEVQLHIGLFTWLGFLIDDDDSEAMTSELAVFQAHFSSGQPTSSSSSTTTTTLLLGCFADVLRATYAFWDPVVANFIVLSALAFVSANALAARREFRDMVPARAGKRWAYHFRNIEGLPEVYTYFTFPAARCPDVGAYLQAVPDMGRFINLTNDILSFYKEEVAGETKNYINSLANYEGKSALVVLQEVIGKSMRAYLRTIEILDGKGEYAQAWREYVVGYVTMHLTSSRYLFREIGLDGEYLVT